MKPPPSLSLPARLYLLACDPRRNRLPGRQQTGYLLRAAALTDLVLRGCLVDARGRPAVSGPATGDAVLDGVGAEIAQQRPRRWKVWVRRGERQILDAVEHQLSAAGLVAVESRPVLGIFPRRHIELADLDGVERSRAAVRDILLGDLPLERVDPADAALVALAAAGQLRSVVSGREQRQRRHRIRALTERSGAAVPALRQVLSDLQSAAVTAATVAAAASSGGS